LFEAAQEHFFEANRAYKNDQFQEAADGYLKLISDHPMLSLHQLDIMVSF
jgi:hypothetical protein